MKNLERKIITSGDGSHTLFIPEMNETYHSSHGALQESEHVFIKHGLDFLADSDPITILEVGFGTGLNAILSFRAAEMSGKKIFYHTLEPFPLDIELVKQLNYPELLDEGLTKTFFNLHETAWDEQSEISGQFSFIKYKAKLEDLNIPIEADLIFFDAFAPGKQPEMWSLQNLTKIKGLMNRRAVLVTYCASGQFRRDLKELGFIVESLPGPPGKKEMTRAVKA
ncbi:MAG: tRNA (5-methylaminomethyl-2-thiouridine)(34)-methyltransferase MnmD [Cytophagaceae bacterium]